MGSLHENRLHLCVHSLVTTVEMHNYIRCLESGYNHPLPFTLILFCIHPSIYMHVYDMNVIMWLCCACTTCFYMVCLPLRLLSFS